MKLKFGAIVVDGRGKIGGHVASKNRSGAYLRTKVTPVNPRTSAQSVVRSLLSSISQAWRALTQAQRDAWNTAVNDFKKTNIFGDLHSPSGFALYQRLNNNVQSVGGDPLLVPPSPTPVGYMAGLSIAADASSHTLILTFDAAIPAGIQAVISATPQVSPGKNFVKSEFRVIGLAEDTDVSPLDVSAMYTAIFGQINTVGKKVFVEVKFIDGTTGVAGIPIQAQTIVVA